MWVLLGIAVLVAGFVARLNPLAVILATAVVTGVAAVFAPGVSVAGGFLDPAKHTDTGAGLRVFQPRRFFEQQ